MQIKLQITQLIRELLGIIESIPTIVSLVNTLIEGRKLKIIPYKAENIFKFHQLYCTADKVALTDWEDNYQNDAKFFGIQRQRSKSHRTFDAEERKV